MKQLPERDSELIRLAVHDLELVEKDEKYVVNMGLWHHPEFIADADVFDNEDVEFCEVCFAGAVMSKTLEFNLHFNPINDELENNENYDRFAFLDNIRAYILDDHFMKLPDSFDNKHIEEIRKVFRDLQNFVDELPSIEYHEGPTWFKKNMLLIADKFEEVGL